MQALVVAARGAVAELIEVLGKVSVPDAVLVDVLRGLEELKASAGAGQAVAAVRLDASQRREQEAAGVPRADLGRGVGAQVALARRDSPARGGRHLGLAKALAAELPCTFTGLASGRISEWRATLIARETACLDPADRAEVDRAVAGNLDEVDRLGDRQLIARLRRHTYRLDPHSVVRRARKAETERYVSLRPAPDTMCWLTALLPVAQGVAVYAALSKAADTARTGAEERGRGQVMADTLIQRITGRDATQPPPLEVQLILTDRTLLHADTEPAHLPGYGTVPAGWATNLINAAGRSRPPDLTLRRLYTAPGTGELIAMDSRARTFPPGLARFINTRDQHCRTPWCSAPIRHIDHAQPHAHGGPTTADNGQGLCENCNYTKQAPGWTTTTSGTPSDIAAQLPPGDRAPVFTHQRGTIRPGEFPARDGSPARGGSSATTTAQGIPGPHDASPAPPTSQRHATIITTPTGHTYVSSAQPLPGAGS